MPFSQAIKTCLRRYVDFTGRATRAEFWWWCLGCGMVAGMMNLLQAALIASAAFEWWPENWGFGPWALLAFAVAQIGRIVNIAMILPSLAVTSRRLHDIGRSGWWQLIWWPTASLALVLGVVLFLFYGPFGLMGLEDSFSRDACPLGAPYPNLRVHRPGCCWRGYVHPGRYLAIPPGTTFTQPLRPGPALTIPAGQRLQPDHLLHRTHRVAASPHQGCRLIGNCWAPAGRR